LPLLPRYSPYKKSHQEDVARYKIAQTSNIRDMDGKNPFLTRFVRFTFQDKLIVTLVMCVMKFMTGNTPKVRGILAEFRNGQVVLPK
ncbi:hypothetical protein BCU79_15500, partial [Vibrio breoganii]